MLESISRVRCVCPASLWGVADQMPCPLPSRSVRESDELFPSMAAELRHADAGWPAVRCPADRHAGISRQKNRRSSQLQFPGTGKSRSAMLTPSIGKTEPGTADLLLSGGRRRLEAIREADATIVQGRPHIRFGPANHSALAAAWITISCSTCPRSAGSMPKIQWRQRYFVPLRRQ